MPTPKGKTGPAAICVASGQSKSTRRTRVSFRASAQVIALNSVDVTRRPPSRVRVIADTSRDFSTPLLQAAQVIPVIRRAILEESAAERRLWFIAWPVIVECYASSCFPLGRSQATVTFLWYYRKVFPAWPGHSNRVKVDSTYLSNIPVWSWTMVIFQVNDILAALRRHHH